MDEGFALILAEEMRREQPAPRRQTVQSDQTVVMERKNFTRGDAFVVGDDQRAFPVHGNGELQSLLVISGSGDYRLHIELDTTGESTVTNGETQFVNEEFATLEELSAELSSIAAFGNNEGDKVLEVGGVDFIEDIRVWIEPTDTVTFRRARAELRMERFVAEPQ